jgi:hypothetical protein
MESTRQQRNPSYGDEIIIADSVDKNVIKGKYTGNGKGAVYDKKKTIQKPVSCAGFVLHTPPCGSIKYPKKLKNLGFFGTVCLLKTQVSS